VVAELGSDRMEAMLRPVTRAVNEFFSRPMAAIRAA